MDFKERGITVGDILIFFIFIISTIFLINSFKESDNKAYSEIIIKEIKKTEAIIY